MRLTRVASCGIAVLLIGALSITGTGLDDQGSSSDYSLTDYRRDILKWERDNSVDGDRTALDPDDRHIDVTAFKPGVPPSEIHRSGAFRYAIDNVDLVLTDDVTAETRFGGIVAWRAVFLFGDRHQRMTALSRCWCECDSPRWQFVLRDEASFWGTQLGWCGFPGQRDEVPWDAVAGLIQTMVAAGGPDAWGANSFTPWLEGLLVNDAAPPQVQAWARYALAIWSPDAAERESCLRILRQMADEYPDSAKLAIHAVIVREKLAQREEGVGREGPSMGPPPMQIRMIPRGVQMTIPEKRAN